MKIKKIIYPKTIRIDNNNDIVITEKLDGSNLGIFKLNGVIHFAQRNNIISYDGLDFKPTYGGLKGWADEHIEYLKEQLQETSCLLGEWIGMGKLKYKDTDIDKRFYMFAKANIDENYDLTNVLFNHNYFIYPFGTQVIPEFIGIVPTVCVRITQPSVENLDGLYDRYTELKGRRVEGFVIALNDRHILKYVRMKNGKLAPHKTETGIAKGYK